VIILIATKIRPFFSSSLPLKKKKNWEHLAWTTSPRAATRIPFFELELRDESVISARREAPSMDIQGKKLS